MAAHNTVHIARWGSVVRQLRPDSYRRLVSKFRVRQLADRNALRSRKLSGRNDNLQATVAVHFKRLKINTMKIEILWNQTMKKYFYERKK